MSDKSLLPDEHMALYGQVRPDDDTRTCPTCDGEGTITVAGMSVNPSTGIPVRDPQCDHDERCATCGGTGSVRLGTWAEDEVA